MAEAVDLDEWEVLSADSYCKEEFEEDDFTYLDLERKGTIYDAEKSVKFDYGEVMDLVEGGSSSDNLVKVSRDFDSETVVSSGEKGLGVVICTDSAMDCSDLARGYDENDAHAVRDNQSEKFVSSVNSNEHDSIGELGFGEMEVLNEFYLNQIDNGTVNYDKACLTRENDVKGENEQFYLETRNSSVFPFQGIDNSDSGFSREQILDWKSPKAIFAEARKEKGGFFEGEMGFQFKISDGDCSKELKNINSGANSSNVSSFILAKDLEEQIISSEENTSKNTKAETGSEVDNGAKGEKVLLAWWKAPIDVIKYYVLGVRPVWSISVAMGFLGFLMFSRSYYLYKMRQKDSKTRPPLKVHFDEKKMAMIQIRAARLNKAVSLVRRDPILRTPFPAIGVTMFPAMSSFHRVP